MIGEKRYQVVLVRPEDGANVGAVCRAMKTMGLTRLVLVDLTAGRLDINRVKHVSVHAFDIFEDALFKSGLDEALSDSVLSAGFTRRQGKRRKYISYLPEQLIEKTSKLHSGEVSLVFGNERTGLTEDELNCCDCSVTVPSDPRFPSLNLSHAVQIITYLLFRSEAEAKETTSAARNHPVSRNELETTVASVTGALERTGFFTLTGKEEMARFLRDIFARALISPAEAERLESLFQKIADLKINRR
jgi:tRNA/rRNA methyltransferase